MGGSHSRWSGSFRSRAGFGLALLLIGCSPERPPSYITARGIHVGDTGRHYSPEEVGFFADSFLKEFANRWPPGEARDTVNNANIHFLDVHSYESFGETVAGTVDPNLLWIDVAADGWTLPDSALAHELVHCVDIALTGSTDATHQSWKTNGVYASLSRIGAVVKAQENDRDGGS